MRAGLRQIQLPIESLPSKRARRENEKRPKSLQECVLEVYGREMELAQKERERDLSTENCLENHEISAESRSQVVDWMVQVHYAFSSSAESLFLSVKLMDFYLKSSKTVLRNSDLQPTAIVCILIASKYYEIQPISLSQVEKHVARFSMNKIQIRTVEAHVLATIDFQTGIPTILDSFAMIELSQSKALFIAELTIIDYKLANLPPSQVAQSIYQLLNPDHEQLSQTSIELKLFLRSFRERFPTLRASINKYASKQAWYNDSQSLYN